MRILNTLKDWFKPAPPPDPALQKALSRVFTLIDPMLNTIPVLEKKLGPALDCTLDYCRKLVDALPGPFEVDRHSFSTSPLVHALFPTMEDITVMLAKSQAVREYLEAGKADDSEFIYAMLAARWERKKSLGMAYDGKMLQSDVLIEHLFFADHVLVEPAIDLEDAREKLRQIALDSVLKTFGSYLIKKREERETLQDQCKLERDQINVMRSMGQPAKEQEHTARLQAAEEALRQNFEALRPENIVGHLETFLSTPEKALHLEKMSIVVDRNGIVTNDSENVGNGTIESLDFQEIIGRDRRRYVAMLARIKRDDVREAMEKLRDIQQRYLVI